MLVQGTLSKLQAEEIFKKEAVLIDDQDVIPVERAEKYLSKESIDFGMRYKSPRCNSNCFGIDGIALSPRYFYRRGFEAAVTHHNVMQLIKEDEQR